MDFSLLKKQFILIIIITPFHGGIVIILYIHHKNSIAEREREMMMKWNEVALLGFGHDKNRWWH